MEHLYIYIYISSYGNLSITPTNLDGHFVRIIGYGLGNNQIFLDPDKTWVEIVNSSQSKG